MREQTYYQPMQHILHIQTITTICMSAIDFTHTQFLMKRLLKLLDDTIITQNTCKQWPTHAQNVAGLAVQLHERDPNNQYILTYLPLYILSTTMQSLSDSIINDLHKTPFTLSFQYQIQCKLTINQDNTIWIYYVRYAS